MSRSYHKRCSTKGIFINWVCYKSNKKNKRKANRRIRRQVHQNLKNYREEKILLQYPREVSDVWDFDSDGLKHYKRVKQVSNNQYIIIDSYYPKIWTKEELRKEFFCK